MHAFDDMNEFFFSSVFDTYDSVQENFSITHLQCGNTFIDKNLVESRIRIPDIKSIKNCYKEAPREG